jgi:hypothetical protein
VSKESQGGGDTSDVDARLKKARAHWVRACVILEAIRPRRGLAPMEEDHLHGLCRKRMAEITELRDAIREFVLCSGFHIFPDLAEKYPKILRPDEQLVRAWKALVELVREDLPDDSTSDGRLQFLRGGRGPGGEPAGGGADDPGRDAPGVP